MAEVLAAVSLTTDLASGVAFEKGLRTCAVATAFGRELGLPPDERASSSPCSTRSRCTNSGSST